MGSAMQLSSAADCADLCAHVLLQKAAWESENLSYRHCGNWMTCAPGIFGLPHFWAVAEVVCVVVWFAVAVLVWSGSVDIAVTKLAHSRY